MDKGVELLPYEGSVHASGAYPAEVRGFKSHPLHQIHKKDIGILLNLGARKYLHIRPTILRLYITVKEII